MLDLSDTGCSSEIVTYNLLYTVLCNLQHKIICQYEPKIILQIRSSANISLRGHQGAMLIWEGEGGFKTYNLDSAL